MFGASIPIKDSDASGAVNIGIAQKVDVKDSLDYSWFIMIL
jgi:hypothetical protein